MPRVIEMFGLQKYRRPYPPPPPKKKKKEKEKVSSSMALLMKEVSIGSKL